MATTPSTHMSALQHTLLAFEWDDRVNPLGQPDSPTPARLSEDRPVKAVVEVVQNAPEAAFILESLFKRRFHS